MIDNILNRYSQPVFVYGFLAVLLLAVAVSIVIGDGTGTVYAGAAGR